MRIMERIKVERGKQEILVTEGGYNFTHNAQEKLQLENNL